MRYAVDGMTSQTHILCDASGTVEAEQAESAGPGGISHFQPNKSDHQSEMPYGYMSPGRGKIKVPKVNLEHAGSDLMSPNQIAMQHSEDRNRPDRFKN